MIVADLDATTQRLALCLGGTNLFIEVGKIADADRGHHAIAVLHLLDRPFECTHSLAWLRHHRREQVWDIVIDAEFQHLGINHDHARSEEHTSELQSLMRISYAVFCLK